MNDGKKERTWNLNNLITKIKQTLKKEEPIDWSTPDSPKPKVTDEEIIKAVQGLNPPKITKRFPWWRVESLFVILWGLGHFVLLYAMIGSPISGGILVYVLIDLIIFIRHVILLRRGNIDE